MWVWQAGGRLAGPHNTSPAGQQGGAILSLAWRNSVGTGFLAAGQQALCGRKKSHPQVAVKEGSGCVP